MNPNHKKMSEMTLEELWTLFPIFLVPHNPSWTNWYEEEKDQLLSILDHTLINRIEHIGSTAVPNIMAKNIVDILIEATSEDAMTLISEKLITS